MQWKRTILSTLIMTLAALVLFGFLNIEQLPPISVKETVNDLEPATGLDPVVAENRDKLIVRAEEIGITAVITDGYRSEEEQDALYAQGRTTEGDIVTNVRGGESMHNYGLAIDFALRTDDGDIIWDLEYDGNENGESDWMEVVEIAKDLGFEWGGDWASFKDYPHLQMNPQQ